MKVAMTTTTMNYPENHSSAPLHTFLCNAFIIDGVRCFYPIDASDGKTSKSNMTLEEFRALQHKGFFLRTFNEKKPNEYIES